MASTFERIVVPIDGSDPSRAASLLALKVASTCGGHLIFCHVLDTRELYDKAATYGYDPRPLLAQMRAEAEDLLDGAIHQAHAGGIEAEYAIVEGRPVDAILAAAAARKANLIVIGTHGRRGLVRLLVGSTTEGVLRATGVPVLVVRAEDKPR